MKELALLLTLYVAYSHVSGHGMMLDPVNRSSMWRYGWDVPKNFNDNELFCGGFGVQYHQNDGKCGVCGDNWADPEPRANEAGGTYAKGFIVANYTKGQTIDIIVDLTANHRGHFEFKICPNNDVSKVITQECLDQYPLALADGSGFERPIDSDCKGNWTTTVKLPADVTCTQCVLQWHYKAGNSWGDCGDGTSAVGCGDQEIFRGCADIGIY